MTKRRPTPPRQWRPLERAVPVIHGTDTPTPDQQETWMNDRYVVTVERGLRGHVHHLSIRRQDRKPARDWRDFQRIKDQLAGHDVEAIELYPARARVADSANQYHLWCLPPGQRIPVGFTDGLVMDHGEGPEAIGAVQRPIDPADRAPGGILSEAPGVEAFTRSLAAAVADRRRPPVGHPGVRSDNVLARRNDP